MSGFYIAMLCLGGSGLLLNLILFSRRPSFIGGLGVFAGVVCVVFCWVFFAGVTL